MDLFAGIGYFVLPYLVHAKVGDDCILSYVIQVYTSCKIQWWWGRRGCWGKNENEDSRKNLKGGKLYQELVKIP